jgi:hypothetical protein
MGVFTRNGVKEALELFTLYDFQIGLRGRILGGVPKNPELVEGWLRAKAGMEDTEEIRQAMLRSLFEMGVEVTAEMSFEEAVEASKKVASAKQTTGFKRDRVGLYIENRQIKAGLKENINILYAGGRIGKTNKGPKSYAAERVFVAPHRLYLRRITGRAADGSLVVGDFVKEPDGIELMIGHVSGPQGQRSTLTYHEYVQECVFEATVMVAEDSIPADWWPRVWTLFENNGVGACRSQSFGTFDIEQWEKRGVPTAQQYEAMIKADEILLSEMPVPGRDGVDPDEELAAVGLAPHFTPEHANGVAEPALTS